jgi:ribosome silencing factor RsfS/YbeB/iojap
MRVPGAVTRAARAAIDKKAAEVVVLDLRKQAAFTDFFVLASATNQKQLLAVADAVQEAMRAEGLRPKHVEGYPRQEWSSWTTRASSSTSSPSGCGCSTTSSGCGAAPRAWK